MSGAVRDFTINSLQLLPSNPDHMIVCVKDSCAYLVHATGGQLIRKFSSGKATPKDFLCAAVSPKGSYLVCPIPFQIMMLSR